LVQILAVLLTWSRADGQTRGFAAAGYICIVPTVDEATCYRMCQMEVLRILALKSQKAHAYSEWYSCHILSIVI
jgi:hypothetical protein